MCNGECPRRAQQDNYDGESSQLIFLLSAAFPKIHAVGQHHPAAIIGRQTNVSAYLGIGSAVNDLLGDEAYPDSVPEMRHMALPRIRVIHDSRVRDLIVYVDVMRTYDQHVVVAFGHSSLNYNFAHRS